MSTTTTEIDFACPHCGQQYSVDPSMIGHSTRCQTCGKIIMISVPGRSKAVSRTASSHLRETVAASSERKSFSQRDFMLGAITTALIFIGGIWLHQKGIVKITTASKSASAPIVEPAPPPSPKPVSSVSSPPPKPSTPVSAKSVVPKKTVESEPGEALYKEAMRYYNGDDVLQDYTRAVELLKQASEKGSAKADGELAFIYWGGRANQQRDRAKAIAYANKSGNHKTQLAHQVLGLSYLFGEENIQQQNFELAYSELSNATDYFYCGFLVGLMRYHGVGTKEDKKGAAEVFFSICKTKIKQEIVGMAALCLGYMYVQGEGVGKNMSEGVSWMKWGIKASKRDFLNDFYKMAEGAATYETYKGMRGIAQRYGSSDISFPDKWPGPDGDGGMDLPEKALKLYFDEQLFR